MSASWIDASRFARSTKVIAVVDVVESVRLMEQDEQEFIRRWQHFVGFALERVGAEGGRLHKSLGDGLMLEFSDPDGCIRSALALHAWFAEANRHLAPGDQVHLRIGAHLAEFVADAYDIYGTDVNLAARIASLAGPGETIISAALRERLASCDSTLEDLGTCHLKHMKDPLHAFRVGEAGTCPVLPFAVQNVDALRPNLAVLPFGIRGAAADGITGEALADDFVAGLARSPVLQVVSRLATARLDQDRSTLEEVRRQGRLAYVMRGHALRESDRVALYVELADASSGHVAWARKFEGALRDLGAADGTLWQELATQVHAAVFERETERARDLPLPSLDASTLLLASIALMHRLTPADMARAQAMLEHLTERWPRHPAPHAWLAHLHVVRLRLQPACREPEARLARDRVAAALRCDIDSPIALAMDGYARLHAEDDRGAAAESYAQGLAVRPDDALLLLLQAELLALGGDGVLAQENVVRALRGFPFEPMRYLHDSVRALATFAAGDSRPALEFAQRSVHRQSRCPAARAVLAACQATSGRMEEARASVMRLLQVQPGFTVPSFLARLPAAAAVRQRLAEGLALAGAPGA